MIRRIARPLLGSIFIYGGYRTLRDAGKTAPAAAPLVERATELLPDSSAVPQDPQTWVRINAGVQLGGGVLLATGKLPRVASLALAGSLVPTTYLEYPFWTESDPAARDEALTHFLQNVALLGGLIIAGFDTEGRPGVVWRTKHAAGQLSDQVSGALSSVTPSDSTTSELSDRAHEWLSSAEDLASQAADRLATATKVAGERLEEAAATAAETTRRTAPVVADQVRTASENVRDRAVPLVAERARAVRDQMASR